MKRSRWWASIGIYHRVIQCTLTRTKIFLVSSELKVWLHLKVSHLESNIDCVVGTRAIEHYIVIGYATVGIWQVNIFIKQLCGGVVCQVFPYKESRYNIGVTEVTWWHTCTLPSNSEPLNSAFVTMKLNWIIGTVQAFVSLVWNSNVCVHMTTLVSLIREYHTMEDIVCSDNTVKVRKSGAGKHVGTMQGKIDGILRWSNNASGSRLTLANVNFK